MKKGISYLYVEIFLLSLLFLILISCKNKQHTSNETECNELYNMLYQTYDSLNLYYEAGKEEAVEQTISFQDSIVKKIKTLCGVSHEVIDLIYSRNLFLQKYDKGIEFLEDIPDTSYKLTYGKTLKIGILKLFKTSENNTKKQNQYSKMEKHLISKLTKFRKNGDSLRVDISIEYVKNINKNPEQIQRRIIYIKNNPELFYKSSHEYFITYLNKLIQLKRNHMRNFNKEQAKENNLEADEYFEVVE